MTTHTQTAFVLVPREPTDEMLEASVSPRYEFLTDAHVSVLKDGFAAKYRAMLLAAPKPPESEIGPVANYLLGDAKRRIEADRDIITALRAEVERLQECAVTWEHNWKSERDVKLDCISRVKAADARAEAAEARVKELEEVLIDVRSAADSFRDEDGDAVASQVISRASAALASKKETVDE